MFVNLQKVYVRLLLSTCILFLLLGEKVISRKKMQPLVHKNQLSVSMRFEKVCEFKKSHGCKKYS